MKFFFGIIVGIALVLGAVFIYFGFGFAPVATSAPPMPFEKTFAGWALDARIEKEMPENVPISADEANLDAGAHVYVNNCSMCHGLPENRMSPMREAFYPHPPQLFQGIGVTDDPPGETFWVVTNGIRMTGMPSFESILSEDQRWQVSLVLAEANRLPADVTMYLKTAELSK